MLIRVATTIQSDLRNMANNQVHTMPRSVKLERWRHGHRRVARCIAARVAGLPPPRVWARLSPDAANVLLRARPNACLGGIVAPARLLGTRMLRASDSPELIAVLLL
eukprot:3563761-Pleurochrysis_carterae.AAC.2